MEGRIAEMKNNVNGGFVRLSDEEILRLFSKLTTPVEVNIKSAYNWEYLDYVPLSTFISSDGKRYEYPKPTEDELAFLCGIVQHRVNTEIDFEKVLEDIFREAACVLLDACYNVEQEDMTAYVIKAVEGCMSENTLMMFRNRLDPCEYFGSIISEAFSGAEKVSDDIPDSFYSLLSGVSDVVRGYKRTKTLEENAQNCILRGTEILVVSYFMKNFMKYAVDPRHFSSLMSRGLAEVIKAAKTYDPAKGRFSTYLCAGNTKGHCHLQGAASKYVDEITGKYGLSVNVRKVRKALEEFEKAGSGKPALKDICMITGLQPADVHSALGYLDGFISLDETFEPGSAQNSSVNADVEDDILFDSVRNVLQEKLTEEEYIAYASRRVIAGLLGEQELSERQLGVILGRSGDSARGVRDKTRRKVVNMPEIQELFPAEAINRYKAHDSFRKSDSINFIDISIGEEEKKAM